MLACEKLKEAGARRGFGVTVGGAFHSPLMEPAREELAAANRKISVFKRQSCAIYKMCLLLRWTDPGGY